MRYDPSISMRRHETLILAALLVLFVLSAYALRFTVDDAYIAMRYSRNLAEGRGLVYNAGEYVEGFTSPLWVLILAAAHALGFGMVTASHVIGVALSVLTIVLVYRMAARALPDGPVAARLIPVVFLSTSWIYAGWATGGLETALYACVTGTGRQPLADAGGAGDPAWRLDVGREDGLAAADRPADCSDSARGIPDGRRTRPRLARGRLEGRSASRCWRRSVDGR